MKLGRLLPGLRGLVAHGLQRLGREVWVEALTLQPRPTLVQEGVALGLERVRRKADLAAPCRLASPLRGEESSSNPGDGSMDVCLACRQRTRPIDQSPIEPWIAQ